MSRYRNVHCLIWNDDKFPFVSDDCQLLWFHLSTTPLTGPIGIYKATLEGLAAEKRWSLQRYRKAFAEGLGKGFWKYDERFHVVLFPKFFKYNKPENPNVLISWVKVYDEIPNSILKDESIQSLKDFAEGWGKAFAKVTERLGQTFPEQEQEQEQEQERDRESAPPEKPVEDIKDKIPAKKLYLEYVMLTNVEFEKLVEKFGKDGAQSWIEEINIARGRNTKDFDKKYTSHYHTILSWHKLREKKNPPPPQPPGSKGPQKPTYYRDKEGKLRSLVTHELVDSATQKQSSEPVNLEGVSNVHQLVIGIAGGMAS
jgi:hypothetical protein